MIEGMKADDIQSIPFLAAIPEADLKQLLPYLEVRSYERGDNLWEEGETSAELLALAAGSVKLVKMGERGKQTIIQVSRQGQLLCGNAPCSFAPFCCRAEVLEASTRVVVVPRRDLMALLERSTVAAEAFRRELSNRSAALCLRVEELASGQVDRRIAKLLIRLAEEVGTQELAGGTFIPAALSRQDLADMCGTTIETASRVMTRFSKAGLVHTRPNGFEVADMEGLMAVVDGEPR